MREKSGSRAAILVTLQWQRTTCEGVPGSDGWTNVIMKTWYSSWMETWTFVWRCKKLVVRVQICRMSMEGDSHYSYYHCRSSWFDDKSGGNVVIWSLCTNGRCEFQAIWMSSHLISARLTFKFDSSFHAKKSASSHLVATYSATMSTSFYFELSKQGPSPRSISTSHLETATRRNSSSFISYRARCCILVRCPMRR